jgi:para-nitrobenzyl esterase
MRGHGWPFKIEMNGGSEEAGGARRTPFLGRRSQSRTLTVCWLINTLRMSRRSGRVRGKSVRFATCLLAGLLLSVLPFSAIAAENAIVSVDSGKLEGETEAGAARIHIFRGIPFAAPPVGALRWREPQPAPAWSGVRQAKAFGMRCMLQPLFSDMMFRSSGISEDCLYLNVWTPAAPKHSSARRRPVLVYVYGGGFVAGDSSEKRYDGTAMARRGIVVVTVNYRLGVFGFLAHPELGTNSPDHASGNYGLLDQAAALAWVRRNIAAFGGDPYHITIGGESAGSMSVSAMMVSPLTRDKIAGAIGESGALLQKWSPPSRASAEQTGATFAQKLGAPTIAALRALPADQLLEAQGKAEGLSFGPIIDGAFLTEAPSATYAAGNAARVPLLVGSNSQEAPGSAIFGSGPATVATYRAGLLRTLGDKADAIFSLYPAHADAEVMPAATAVASDDFLALPTWKWFDLQRRSGAPTFYYHYTRVRPRFATDTSNSPLPWGAVHSAEIEYALGNLDANPLYAWTAADRTVAATMSGYFANFIKTGDPNGEGLPRWTKASSNASKIKRQIIDVDTQGAAFPEQGRYTAAESILYMH